ncbi:MAG: hypothetical protein NXH72_11625 [Hyphomonadaceae bacterium]|nr:hypothetical protein [Hyphomonadaceae bacterium]
MKLIITSVVAIIFIALGSFAGVVLKSPSEAVAASTVEAASDKDEAAKKDAKKDDHSDKTDDAKTDVKASSSGDSNFYKFSREFVVPIMREGQVTSLVILHISVEHDPSISDKMFSEDPKLRDNIMTTLITLSNDGRTLERPTEINNYETIRAMVLMNLRDAISDKIKNVLIIDMAKQDL